VLCRSLEQLSRLNTIRWTICTHKQPPQMPCAQLVLSAVVACCANAVGARGAGESGGVPIAITQGVLVDHAFVSLQ